MRGQAAVRAGCAVRIVECFPGYQVPMPGSGSCPAGVLVLLMGFRWQDVREARRINVRF